MKTVSGVDKQKQESKKTVESKPKTKKVKKPDIPEGQMSLF